MVYKLKATDIFTKWINTMRNRSAKNRILARLEVVKNSGHFGDHKEVGKNLFEMRFFFGSGYRVYYTIQKKTVVFLLCGGDKSSQKKDIFKAKQFLEI